MSGVPNQEEEQQDPYIRLKNSRENHVFFKVRRGAQLKKLMSGVPKQEVEQQDPYIRLKVQNQLGMEDGDEIDAMLPQTGGFAI